MPGRIEDALFELVPSDGSAIGNIALHRALSAALRREVSDGEFATLRDELLRGLLAKGAGRGGSVRHVALGSNTTTFVAKDFDLAHLLSGGPRGRIHVTAGAKFGEHVSTVNRNDVSGSTCSGGAEASSGASAMSSANPGSLAIAATIRS